MHEEEITLLITVCRDTPVMYIVVKFSAGKLIHKGLGVEFFESILL